MEPSSVERQSIGIKRALANGAKFGRKKKITDKVIDEVRAYREQGHSYRAIAELTNLNVSTVHKASKMTSLVV